MNVIAHLDRTENRIGTGPGFVFRIVTSTGKTAEVFVAPDFTATDATLKSGLRTALAAAAGAAGITVTGPDNVIIAGEVRKA